MRNVCWLIVSIGLLVTLISCSDEEESDELKMLDVDFELPEAADMDETIELKATVTYGDEKVDDADEMEFEYWEEGNRDDSSFVDGENNEDGTYTADVSFDQDGTYEVYAHTTARTLHTMPKKSIKIGDDSDDEVETDKNKDEE